ncbi:transforming growth factor beta activator LRRC32-like [Polypterus senegalus]
MSFTAIILWFLLLCLSYAYGNQTSCYKVTNYEISCCHLNLSFIPEQLGHELKKLDLSHNHIRNLNSKTAIYLKSLQELNLAWNYLGESDTNGQLFLQPLTQLRLLDMSFNDLNLDVATEFLQNLSSLQFLYLKGNKIVKLSSHLFQGMPNLCHINLEQNLILEIEEGTFENLKSLAVLNLAINALHCISDFRLPQLQVLNLSQNSIELFVTAEKTDIYQLTTLDLSHNRLLSFPILPQKNILQNLYLQNNQMDVLFTKTVVLERKFLPKGMVNSYMVKDKKYNQNSRNWLGNITHLDLSKNHLSSLPFHILKELVALQHLDLSDNCLLDIISNTTSLEELAYLPSLRSLDLQRNQIRYIPHGFFHLLPKIEVLHLGDNRVKLCGIIDKNDSSVTQEKKRDERCVSFSGIRTLKHLSLQSNNITRLFPNMFHQTPLVTLDLSGNKKLKIAEGALNDLNRSLEVLNLSSNHMTTSELRLPCLPKLQMLDLSNNRINTLPKGIACAALMEADVRNNSLRSLDEWMVAHWSATLQSLWISGNPFNCCSLTWLKVLTEDRNIHLPDLQLVHCLYWHNTTQSANVTNNHSQHCLADASTVGDMLVLILIILLFVALSMTATVYFLSRKKCHKLVEFKSNKVASFQYNQDAKQSHKEPQLDMFVTNN